MKKSALIEEKIKTQKRFDKESGHDLKKYAAHVHRLAVGLKRKYGISLSYAKNTDAV